MIGTKNLKCDIQTQINAVDNATSVKEMSELDAASTNVDSYQTSSITCFDLLPDASLNKGRLIYVSDQKCYYYSNGEEWIDDFSSTCSGAGECSLWGWGSNNAGQLGDGTITSRRSPVTTAAGGTDWCDISTGLTHTLALKTDGTLWSWGCNNLGQLGDGTIINRSSPGTTIAGGTDWCAIAVGDRFSLALKADGTLWTWGTNVYGELGDNSVICRSLPVTTTAGGTDWCAIAAGVGHSLAIKTDGTLWAWGRNNAGQLGDNTAICRSSPVTTVAGGTDWCAIAAGNFHSLVIKTDGTLWSWGVNSQGVLGDGTSINRSSPVTTAAEGNDWCAIAAGSRYSLAIKTDGTLWSWGCNNVGQLGDGTLTCRSSPGTTAAGGTDWCDISTGLTHTLALKTDGTLWSWGCNDLGQLGDGTVANRSSPGTITADISDWNTISAGNGFSLAINFDILDDYSGF